MSKGQAAKSEVTRGRILEAAIALFAERGFAAATMREIAERADCSLGLSYRYFRSKDAIALALYQRMLEEYAEAAEQIEPGPLSKRWGQATRADFARLAPHRPTLMGLTSAGLAPGSTTQVLGEDTRPIRVQMLSIFGRLIAGATDLPRATPAEALAPLLYGVHLLLVLFWLQDPTPDQKATASLVALFEEFLGALRFVVRIRGVRNVIQRLSDILRPVLAGDDHTSLTSDPDI